MPSAGFDYVPNAVLERRQRETRNEFGESEMDKYPISMLSPGLETEVSVMRGNDVDHITTSGWQDLSV